MTSLFLIYFMTYVGRDVINVRSTAASFIRLASLGIHGSISSLVFTVGATRHSFRVTPVIV